MNQPMVPDNPYVYALVDDFGSVFYIGKGRGRRMFQHRYDAVRGKPGVRLERIREVLARGNDIACSVLGEYRTDKEACQAEIEFIAAHESLTNLTKGGEIGGCADPKPGLIESFRALRAKILPIEQWIESRGEGYRAMIFRAFGQTPEEFYKRMVDEIDMEIADPSPTSAEWDAKTGKVKFGWSRVVTPSFKRGKSYGNQEITKEIH